MAICLASITANAAPWRARYLFQQPNASSPAPVPKPDPGKEEAEAALEDALEWRSLAMLDEKGLIPAGAVYRANLFRKQQLLNMVAIPGVTGLAIGAKNPHAESYLNTASWGLARPAECRWPNTLASDRPE